MAHRPGPRPARRTREDAEHYLRRLAQVALARELIARGARLLLLRWATQLPTDRLVALYRHHVGSNAAMFPSGAVPRLSTFVQEPLRNLKAALFATVVLHQQGNPADLVLTPETLIGTFDLYRRLDPQPLPITDCYLIARGLRAGLLRLSWCPQCNAGHLVQADKPKSPRNRCPRCSRAPLDRAAGRAA